MLIADLHIHSKYSRATSKEGDPEHLDLWARKKGIQLLGTGDFTHPAWRAELTEKLCPAEEGLYTLREDCRLEEPSASGFATRFVVSGEISSIYSKNGRTRKVHNLILLPSLEAAEELSRKLEAIGNIHSDGRPILGLDSRDLLELTLETCPNAIFVPAHIWTPHFSLFGAFSGFDAIEECFEDLTPYIHALETGLSSDPPMNWRVSALDGYTLISNSDAHSPAKLGREANLLDIQPSYPALERAIQTGDGFAGTIEFFPEEGKYHYDGHRNCGLCLTPAEADQYGGRCPVCGKKLTIGVQHRVEQLADRQEGFVRPGAKAFESLSPLPEVIAASTGLSAGGTKAAQLYEHLLQTLGPEFEILRTVPADLIEAAAGPCVAEGIRRLRAGRVLRSPGFDGEYGKIELLSKSEIEAFNGQTSLFAVNAPARKKRKLPTGPAAPAAGEEEAIQTVRAETLNPEQLAAVSATEAVVTVVAGPGTGKTKTLVAKIAALIEQGVKPSEITAVTFTNKAAAEMRERLEKRLGGKKAVRAMTIGTFHSICLNELQKQEGPVSLIDEYDALELAADILRGLSLKAPARKLLQAVSRSKNGLPAEETEVPAEACERYCERLKKAGLLDFDDLLLKGLEAAESGGRSGLPYLLVDEFQDINALQYRLVRAWHQNGRQLFAIGDPDQAIYGFRGASAECFRRLHEEYPACREIRLVQNYRSTPEILSCALPVISRNAGEERALHANRETGVPVRLVTAESDLSEGIFVAKEINRLVGGIDMLDAQSFGLPAEERKPRDFSDIAVLYRTHRQADLLESCLKKESIPYVVAGRDDFLGTQEVRAAAAYFRFLTCPEEAYSLHAALRLGWECPEDLAQGAASALAGDSSSFAERLARVEHEYAQVAQVRSFAALTEELYPVVRKKKPRELLERYAQERRLADSDPIRRLINTAVFHKNMPEFLQTLALGQESDLLRGTGKAYLSGAVTLMTLHGSKGLEFPVVFLCGVKKEKIPLESAGRPADLAEERRLFYVGMTRAKEELLLLTSPEPSVFLSDIPQDCLRTEAAAKRRPAPDGVQLSLF